MTPRDVFRRAEGDPPDIARLVSAVPALLAQARRVRALDAEPSSRIFLVGRAWLPRFALATALLAVAALLWPASSRRDASTPGTDEARLLDAWLVTGTVSTSVADPALDAILRQGTP